MKIVCLTRGRPRHNYFVNAIHRHHPISLSIVEYPPSNDKFQRILKERGLFGLARLVVQHYITNGSEKNALDATFGHAWKEVDRGIEVIRKDSINSSTVYELLAKLKPDIILDHGTSIVKGEILSTAELALNLHWGLSPYYRGTSCTEWALVNRDPFNIGVTIHRLSKCIDGGDVVAQRRIAILPEDNVNSINCRLTHQGTELLIAVLDKLKRGESLDFKHQDFSRGFLYLNRHSDEHFRNCVRNIERKRLIQSMLEKPARVEKLPIIEL